MPKPSPREVMLDKYLSQYKGRKLKLVEIQELLKNGMKPKYGGEETTGDYYPLSRLNAHLLEQVVTKLDSTSYFRIQQTCHAMRDFIQKSKNISVRLEDVSLLRVWDGQPSLSNGNRRYKIFDNFNGICLAYFFPLLVEPDPFEAVHNWILRHRITCADLNLTNSNLPYWANDQCKMMMDSLKPKAVQICGDNLDAVFQAKHVTEVELDCDGELAEDAAPRLISTFSKICIIVYSQVAENLSDILLQTVLKALFARPDSLLQFSLYIDDSAKKYCHHRLKRLLDASGLKESVVGSRGRRQFILVKMGSDTAEIRFKNGKSFVVVGYDKNYKSNLDSSLLTTKSCDTCKDDEDD